MSISSGCLTGLGVPSKYMHRAQTDIKVEHLAQGDVERADAAADRRGQRAFDADQIFAEGVQGFIGQPHILAIGGHGFLSGVDFHPGDFPGPAVCFFDRRVQHAHRSRPDVGAGAIALDEGEDGIVGDVEHAVADGDFFPVGDYDFVECHF